MTDNVDFKAAKEWAEMAVDPIRPISPYERNNASAYLALCELLKECKPWTANEDAVAGCAPQVFAEQAALLARIKAAIGE